jgi:uncharacterized protein YbjT (DUF2867 family)
MNTVLVTGATGRLGTPTVAGLRAAGLDVRALSRRSGPGLVTGDLLSGEGMDQALDGADTVVHLATGRRDVEAAGNLITKSRAAGIRNLVVISIVGCDRIPLPYYKGKVAIEKLVVGSGLPFTILRATQFHQLVEGMFSAQRRLPVVISPKIAVQPIDTGDVAARLVELAGGDAIGRAPDIGGPQKLAFRECARQWSVAASSSRRVVPVWLPGKTFAAYAQGHHLVPGPPYGRRAFQEYLAERYPGRS